MNDNTKFLSLFRIIDKEGEIDWSDFEESPEKLIDYIKSNLGIDLNNASEIQSVYIGPDRPELDKIWFNNERTAFIGIPFEGDFVKIYQYPPNSPIILLDESNIPTGVRKLTQDEIDNYGLQALSAPAFWAILETT